MTNKICCFQRVKFYLPFDLGFDFPAALYSSTLKEKQSEGKESKSDSISLQIKTYENLVEEMQRQLSYSSLVNIMSQLGDLYSQTKTTQKPYISI